MMKLTQMEYHLLCAMMQNHDDQHPRQTPRQIMMFGQPINGNQQGQYAESINTFRALKGAFFIPLFNAVYSPAF